MDRPDGVVVRFQIVINTIEPHTSVRARNLLSKDDCRAALAEELEPDRPKIARIGFTTRTARNAPRLTGAATGPDGTVIGPSGESQRGTPAADASEEVALDESAQIVWSNIDN
jgi:hypothetical protein